MIEIKLFTGPATLIIGLAALVRDWGFAVRFGWSWPDFSLLHLQIMDRASAGMKDAITVLSIGVLGFIIETWYEPPVDYPEKPKVL